MIALNGAAQGSDHITLTGRSILDGEAVQGSCLQV